MSDHVDWDFLIIGSGFGGSVSGLRLTEKGYRVLMLEKGPRFRSEDFPVTNWDLKRWMWRPELGWRGLFKMTFFPHVTVLSGVGVGGGSLVYANTLPIPKDDFFQNPSWAHLANWKEELAPHYVTVRRMLGATEHPYTTVHERILQELARDLGREDKFEKTMAAVYFGKPGETVPDPYLGGEGPTRTGCIQCGGCMLGCRHNAKNTLDKNYLWLAERRGLRIEPDTEVTWVRPLPEGGYEVEALHGTEPFGREQKRYTAKNVIFAGGVLGTVDLLLKLAEHPDGLPKLSPRVGDFVRTNSEALIGVTSSRKDFDASKGIAIGSILHTDEHSHLEFVRYPEGSNFFRILGGPHVDGTSFFQRLARMIGMWIKHPWRALRLYFIGDWAKQTMILLYMRTLEGHLRLTRKRSLGTGFRRRMTTALQEGPAPTANIPEATDLARRVEQKVDGTAATLITETLLGIPSTAHILGGACMGDSPETGVIDHRHRVFGYEGLYVIDGSAVSANPGVNPSLTIAALAERAMTFIPPKAEVGPREVRSTRRTESAAAG
ncbi:MAG: GMC family oxidoreductase [Myxococcaceae bacterium]|nr:GMC family oxidoreductase [Myxococcaceae bacterium]